MSRASDLVDAYEGELQLLWRANVSGAERVWMLVYPPELERQMRAQLSEMALRTTRAGRRQEAVELTDELGRWIAEHEYAEAFYEDPGDFTSSVVDMFSTQLVARVRERLAEADENTVLVLVGVAALSPSSAPPHWSRRSMVRSADVSSCSSQGDTTRTPTPSACSMPETASTIAPA